MLTYNTVPTMEDNYDLLPVCISLELIKLK